jgi:hypothetical protein
MILEQQVCSLELAKRLKELGVKQESYFHWKHLTDSPTGPIDKWVLVDYKGSSFSYSFYHISAFTVAELGEMLPRGYISGQSKNDGGHFFCRPDAGGKAADHFTIASTEADARAKMLIYLLEHDLISLT